MERIIETAKGKIAGIWEKDVTIFKGLPYAKPPVGSLRWKAPQEVEPWEGVYHADKFSSRSMQDNGGDPFYQKEFYAYDDYRVPDSEDCLYLNIWAPAEAVGGAKCPVAFWIHGGAFMGGYGSEMEFDGTEYAKRGVILVTINYRLNVYGFLAHPWLNEENERGISGNYGILDQLAALQWVYDNIGAFGGDKDNITVFGQSAGAMSTQTLLSSPLTENKIAKAIMQSGGSYKMGLHRDLPLQQALEYGKRYVSYTGAQNLQQLRALSAQELTEAATKAMGEMAPTEGLFFVPVMDDYVLQQGYNETIAQGKLKNIPYLLGSTKNDIVVTPEDLAQGNKGILYEGCKEFSFAMEEMQNQPSYVYYFTRDLPGDDAGAFHSSELWYMFGTLQRCWRNFEEADYALSARMLDYWTNFMKQGNPNGTGQEEWKPCSKADPFVKELTI